MNKAVPGKITFSFGRNWQEFFEKHLTPARKEQAIEYVKKCFSRDDLNGLTFLDVGCGSGLTSWAAHQLGASEVLGIDVDPFSVECSKMFRKSIGDPPNWRVEHGSILDSGFVSTLPQFDIINAWGSLHHTGKMWEAIRNAGRLAKPGGLFFVTIYNKVNGREGSDYWVKVKRFYNGRGKLGKRSMEAAFFLRDGILPQLIRFRNPFKFLRDYGRERGMTYWTDIKDWLGGYPYEFASPEEIFLFCSRELNMELVDMKTTHTTGTNDFLFRRKL